MRATRFATVALLGVAVGLVAPPVASAQEADFGAIEAQADAAVDAALEGGGVPAVPGVPGLEAAPAPAQPAPPPPVPKPEAPSETATGPAPEAPSAPTNINIDIRILSPGDNGDVVQGISDPGRAGDGPRRRREANPPPSGDGGGFTWDGTWDWGDMGVDCGGAPSACDVVSEVLTEVLPDSAELESFGVPVGPVTALAPLGQNLAQDELVPSFSDRSHKRAAQGPSHAAPAPAEAAPPWAEPVQFVAADARGPTIAPAEPRATRAGSATDRSPAPAPRPTPFAVSLFAPAAGGGGGSGSSVPVAAALFGLLCLLVPRALGVAYARHKKFSSQLSSSRPERPG